MSSCWLDGAPFPRSLPLFDQVYLHYRRRAAVAGGIRVDGTVGEQHAQSAHQPKKKNERKNEAIHMHPFAQRGAIWGCERAKWGCRALPRSCDQDQLLVDEPSSGSHVDLPQASPASCPNHVGDALSDTHTRTHTLHATPGGAALGPIIPPQCPCSLSRGHRRQCSVLRSVHECLR